MTTAPWNLDAGEVLQEGPPLAPATSAKPEPGARDTHQRGLTWDHLSDLVLAVRTTDRAVVRDMTDQNIAADDAALQRLFDALRSIERERDRFRATLEKIGRSRSRSPIEHREIAREALR